MGCGEGKEDGDGSGDGDGDGDGSGDGAGSRESRSSSASCATVFKDERPTVAPETCTGTGGEPKGERRADAGESVDGESVDGVRERAGDPPMSSP